MKKSDKKSVMIIEDDEVLIEMYKEKLKNSGFRALTVKDSKMAMQRIRMGADLILLDLLMPNINGFEVLKRIKSDAETKDIPVIVLTNIGSESLDNDRKLAMSLGATDYMIKSLNTPDSVIARIREILS